MRLIDADAFKDYIRGALKDMRHLFKDNGEWAEEVTEEFCKDIDEQPTIVEFEGDINKVIVKCEEYHRIVRCKDCKHWYSDADTGMACEFTNMGQPEDGFCNWAERRSDE